MSSACEESKKSLPNLTAISHFRTAVRSISKEEKINITNLDDIEESPTPSSTSHADVEVSTPRNESSLKQPQPPILKRDEEPVLTPVTKFQLPKIEYTKEDEDVDSKASEEKRTLKTPKSYFYESLQRRKNQALTNSQCAARLLVAAANPRSRQATPAECEIKETAKEFQDKFTPLELAQDQEETQLEREMNDENHSNTIKVWSTKRNSGTRYEVNTPPKMMEWSYNAHKDAMEDLKRK